MLPDASPSPLICTVDVVLLTLLEGRLHVALLPREHARWAGQVALAGGYVHRQEDASAQASAVRVLQHKARVVSPYLEQLATFSGPARDPRGWSMAVAYYALVPPCVCGELVGWTAATTDPLAPPDGTARSLG